MNEPTKDTPEVVDSIALFAKPYGQIEACLEMLPRPPPSLEELDDQIRQMKVPADA